jgi:hypothetical protein
MAIMPSPYQWKWNLAAQDSKAAPACPPLSHLLKHFDDAVQKTMIF